MLRPSSGWFVLAATAGCVHQPAWHGPLPVRNQHPAQLTVLHLPPARAEVLAPGAVAVRADAAYSSLWLLGTGTTRSWIMDGEYLRVAAGVRAGLGGGCEFGLELPFAHTSGGFLDGFLIDYHAALGLPDQARDSNPRDDFQVEARRGGQVAWSVERDGFAWLDVPLWLTRRLLTPADGRLGLAVRAGVEAPTGDDDRGYGSGGWDPGVGVLAELPLGGVAWYGHLQHSWASTPAQAKRAGLAFADVTSLGGGVELPLAPWLHAYAQLEWETSTLRRLDLPAASRDQLLLWVGGRADLGGDLGLEIGFGEDLQGLVSPDFTAWLGMVWSPGGRAAAPPPGLPR